jgi:hypothetical protein
MDAVLYLRDKAITVIETTGKQGFFEQNIEWDDTDALDEALSLLADASEVALVIDFIDETLHFEWVPKLLPWEKPGLQKRLTEKARGEGGLYVHFSWLPLTRKTSQGLSQQLTMVASILQSPMLEAFFKRLHAAHLPLTHVYSFAFLIETLFFQRLARRLRLSRKQTKQPFMLVFRETEHQFRQIFFQHGHLRIARQVDLDPELEEGAINHALIDETRRAVKYVYNQKLLDLNSEVGFVYVNVAHHDESDIVQLYQENVVQRNWDVSKTFMVGGELGELLKIPAKHTQVPTAILALSRFIAQFKPKTFYQNQYVQAVKGYWLGRKTAWGLGLLLAIGGLVLGLQGGIDAWRLNAQIKEMAHQKTLLEEQKQTLQSRLDLSYDARDIQTTVEFAKAVVGHRMQVSFERLWQSLGQVLNRHPQIALQRLRWNQALPVDSKALELTIEGWVYPFEQSFVPPTKWVNAFTEDLAKRPEVKTVTLTQAPLAASPEQALNLNQSALQTQAALPFQMRVVFVLTSEEGA